MSEITAWGTAINASIQPFPWNITRYLQSEIVKEINILFRKTFSSRLMLYDILFYSGDVAGCGLKVGDVCVLERVRLSMSFNE